MKNTKLSLQQKFVNNVIKTSVTANDVGAFTLKHSLNQQSLLNVKTYRIFKDMKLVEDYIVSLFNKLVKQDIDTKLYFKKDFILKLNRTSVELLLKTRNLDYKYINFIDEDEAVQWFTSIFNSLSKEDQAKINDVYERMFNRQGRGPRGGKVQKLESYLDNRLDSYSESMSDAEKAEFWKSFDSVQKSVISHESTNSSSVNQMVKG
jgi:hypothetical protein